MSSPAAPVSSRPVVIGGRVWFAAAIVFGATGVFGQLRPPGPQIIALALTVLAVTASIAVPSVRNWVDSIPLRGLVGFHIMRFVGVVFLVLAARGAMSPLFATRAGWGDITAAAGAGLLVWSGTPRSARHRWAYLAWNTFGVLDLIVAVGTAGIVVLRNATPGMEPITQLPLILVPVFFVPLLFASHVVIYRRLMSPYEPR